MKKILALCMGVVFFASCEKKEKESIVVNATNVTLNSQGTATLSFRVTPPDMDVSTMGLYHPVMNWSSNDNEVGVDIVSMDKDPGYSGNWTFTIGLVKDSKPYVPQANFKCTMDAKAYLKKENELLKSNEFNISASINN